MLPERIVGRHDGDDGALLVAIGALHGNEPAGVEAIERVLSALRASGIRLRGRLVGLRGNRAALRERRRYLAHDLNRGWSATSVAHASTPRPSEAPEDAERRDLWHTLCGLTDGHRRRAIVVDLHSTSGRASPFLVPPTGRANRRLARRVPAPVVLGLDGAIDGTLLGHLTTHGHVGFAAEGGQHDVAATADRLEAILWHVLVATRMLSTPAVPKWRVHVGRLRASSHGRPRAVAITHRHAVRPEDDFVMLRGWANFKPVARGAELARDRRGPIVAPHDGVLMLPNYQGVGDDGFFLARRVPAWLR